MARTADIRLVLRQRLREARESQQLSQKQLGIRAGIDPFVASPRINRYELGVHEPDLATIARIARALMVPTPYLFADDDRLARLILLFERLSPSDKDRLLHTISASTP